MLRTFLFAGLGVALIAPGPAAPMPVVPAQSPAPAATQATVFRIDNVRFRANVEAPVSHLPMPPPAVLAGTKFIYEVDVLSEKRWGPLGLLPEERYVRMYVTSVSRFGPFRICHGWSVRVPMAGAPIVEPHDTGMCQGRLQPFAGGSPPPPPESIERHVTNPPSATNSES